MKRERILILSLSATVVVVCAVVGYGFYLGEQTRALRASHGPPPAVERFA